MKVDLRAKVLARTMTGEVVLVIVSALCVISMPLYFLKFKPMIDVLKEQKEVQDQELQQRQEEEALRKRVQLAKQNFRNEDMLTADKALRHTPE